ncbi:hypothetical protein [Halosimplex halobium]|uniref:hypothetical protein n=1 Tax=Halosimplex halobium TaxID=3396618 RepID=UPI003F55471F
MGEEHPPGYVNPGYGDSEQDEEAEVSNASEELLVEYYQEEGIDDFAEFTVVHYEDEDSWEGRWGDGRTDRVESLPAALEALADEFREMDG